jgi:hypothetical protein
MTSNGDDLEEALRQNLKLRSELAAEVTGAKAESQRGGIVYRLAGFSIALVSRSPATSPSCRRCCLEKNRRSLRPGAWRHVGKRQLVLLAIVPKKHVTAPRRSEGVVSWGCLHMWTEAGWLRGVREPRAPRLFEEHIGSRRVSTQR